MTFFLLLPFAAAIFSLLLAFISLVPKKRSGARLFFFTGMAALAVDSLLSGLILRATELTEVLRGLTAGFIVKSVLSAAWLGFSLTYSRGDYRESFRRWGIPLTVLALLPIGIALGFQHQLLEVVAEGRALHGPQFEFSAVAKILNIVLLVANLWILMNLEQTFRSAVGTMRWRIKFVVLGLAVIFGSRLYVQSEAVLFSVYDPHWLGLESSGLLIGCIFLVVAYVRTRFAEIEVYPSRAVLGSSLTVLSVGSYLFIVGVLANIVRRLGGVGEFPVRGFHPAPGNGRTGGAASFRSPPAAHPRIRRPPFRQGPARFRSDLDPSSRGGWPTSRIKPAFARRPRSWFAKPLTCCR